MIRLQVQRAGGGDGVAGKNILIEFVVEAEQRVIANRERVGESMLDSCRQKMHLRGRIAQVGIAEEGRAAAGVRPAGLRRDAAIDGAIVIEILIAKRERSGL